MDLEDDLWQINRFDILQLNQTLLKDFLSRFSQRYGSIQNVLYETCFALRSSHVYLNSYSFVEKFWKDITD